MPSFDLNRCLTRAEVDFFVENGYLGPYAAMSPDEMASIRREIEANVLTTDGPNPRSRAQSRHMDQPVVYDLATHPSIIERIAGLLGPDLVVWATNFWLKPPGGAEIPWHQDIHFWPLEPPLNTSAWLAIDKVTVENSCVQVIPGSHRVSLPHVKAEEGVAFAEMADNAAFDAGDAINMELEPGEFFIFSERTLHRSSVNTSDKRRLGISIRVTLPIVHIFQDSAPLHPGHSAILAKGKDVMGFNRYAARPKVPAKSEL
ncbi:MAG: phytanoyl-CoA dioxygenase family protein [Chloroflexi bacterium]|nr:phytanoyl-CoA dioxygenase family protein [Chloroflexota bacterium]